MKNLLFIALLVIATTTSAFADVSQVTRIVLDNFKMEYHDAKNVEWKTTKDYSKATFILDNRQMEVFYSITGEMLACSHNISVDELPTSVKRKVAKKLEGYTFKEAIKFQCPDEECYYVSMEDDKSVIILKVTENGLVSYFNKRKK